MRASSVLSCFLALCSLQHAGCLAAAEPEDFSRAWAKRLGEHAGVAYQAQGEWLTRVAEGGQEEAQKAELRIDARMRCDARKFRFDLRQEGAPRRGLYILDSAGFHSCVQPSPWDWTVDSQRKAAAESDWPLVYPFLLAHGVVPLPPFEAPRLRQGGRTSSASAGSVAGEQAKFTFDEDGFTVTVLHGAQGLVERYQVAKRGRKLLDIANRYRRESGAPQLESFAVVVFADDGRVARRLDAKVTAANFDATLPLDVFSIPKPAEEARASVLELFDKTVRLKDMMSIDEVAKAVQVQVGKDLQVRIDREAFQRWRGGMPNALTFALGEAALSDLLLYQLRNSLVDFYVEPQGIVLIPRNEAWSYAAPVHYSAADYGMEAADLRDLVFNAATLDDWADVGGRAQIIAGESEQDIVVVHTQSDQLRFLHRLGELPKDEGKN